MMDSVINERRAEIAGHSEEEMKKQDLLSRLVSASESEGDGKQGLTKEEVVRPASLLCVMKVSNGGVDG